jgi:hypothetical protein
VLHPTNKNKTMNTTHSIPAGAALGLAQPSNKAVPVLAARPAAAPVAPRKILVLGLLAVASCAAVGLVGKASLVAADTLACLDAVYQGMSH